LAKVLYFASLYLAGFEGPLGGGKEREREGKEGKEGREKKRQESHGRDGNLPEVNI